MDFLISNAWAAETPAPGGGFELLIMMGIFFAIMYFMVIRPQQKRAKEHRAMLDSIQNGSEVVTNGGLMAKVIQVSENFMVLELNEGIEVKVQRQSIVSILPKGSLKE